MVTPSTSTLKGDGRRANRTSCPHFSDAETWNMHVAFLIKKTRKPARKRALGCWTSLNNNGQFTPPIKSADTTKFLCLSSRPGRIKLKAEEQEEEEEGYWISKGWSFKEINHCDGFTLDSIYKIKSVQVTLVSSTFISYNVKKMLASIGLKDCRLIVSLLPPPRVPSRVVSSGFVFTPSSLKSWLIPK